MKLEIYYIIANTVENSDKKSNIKNKVNCFCGDNENTNVDGPLCWIKNNGLRKLKKLGYRNVVQFEVHT